jgi:GNAT superfamily N-acetyltransferase
LTPSTIDLGPRVRASRSDLPDVYALLEEASAWLSEKGLLQWYPAYPLERFTRQVEEGDVWYWKGGESVIATVTLLPRRPEYYPDHVWNDALPAWYVCRLALTRRLAGAGVGKRLLTQIENDAAAARLRALRLDVTASNPFLEEYYKALGYRRAALGESKGGQSIFMEKALELPSS